MPRKPTCEPITRQSDLTGFQFDRLTVVSLGVRTRNAREAYWLCRCECGTEKSIARSSLVFGLTRSCGCLAQENRKVAGKANFKHGLIYTPEYRAWWGMVGRCHRATHPGYPNYGGRGIRVCDLWRYGFETFYADMGPKPSNRHSLDRIDNDNGYAPNNCRWATGIQQGRNRRSSRIITYKGEARTMAEWGEVLGFNAGVIRQRLERGMTVEKAFAMPYVPRPLSYSTEGAS